MMYLFIDTETTGLPKDWNKPIIDIDNWPRIVQLVWNLYDDNGKLVEAKNYYIKPEGFVIPRQATKTHGISSKFNNKNGVFLTEAITEFNQSLRSSKYIVGHNVNFNIDVIGCELHRLGIENDLMNIQSLDTCSEITANLCNLPGERGRKNKLPTLSELYFTLFKDLLDENLNSTDFVKATAKCFFELKNRN